MALENVTHFEITELPSADFVVSKIGAADLEIDTLYPIEDSNTISFDRVSDLDGYFLNFKLKWRTYDSLEEKYSNISESSFFFKETTGLLPEASNLLLDLINSDQKKLIELLPINEAVEFIEIVAINGINNFKFNNIPLVPFQTIETKNLIKGNYKVNFMGGGEPYAEIQYKVGKNNQAEETIYSTIINVDSLAEIRLDSETIENYNDEFMDGSPSVYVVFEQLDVIKIQKGYLDKTAEVSLVLNCTHLLMNEWNYVSVEVNGNVTEHIHNQDLDFVLQLDETGYGEIRIKNVIVEDDPADDPQIEMTLTLDSIDNNPALVSEINTLTIDKYETGTGGLA